MNFIILTQRSTYSNWLNRFKLNDGYYTKVAGFFICAALEHDPFDDKLQRAPRFVWLFSLEFNKCYQGD